MAHSIWKVALDDMGKGRITVKQELFLEKLLIPYAKLDLRKMAQYDMNSDFAEKKQATVELAGDVIQNFKQGIKDLFHPETRAS